MRVMSPFSFFWQNLCSLQIKTSSASILVWISFLIYSWEDESIVSTFDVPWWTTEIEQAGFILLRGQKAKLCTTTEAVGESCPEHGVIKGFENEMW